MRKVKQKAYAKINLSLDILGRLENGYHIVKMVASPAGMKIHMILNIQVPDSVITVGMIGCPMLLTIPGSESEAPHRI